mmetsp:Transcript_1808/g.6465  ORF Transcript_1808/g.6465 Transcript_1808/m.6465 type:complete len:692 (-) Transcript_1808:92-2167(-)
MSRGGWPLLLLAWWPLLARTVEGAAGGGGNIQVGESLRRWPRPDNMDEVCSKYGFKVRPEGTYVPKVYAGTIVFKELDMTEVLLHEYAPYIEEVVLMESVVRFHANTYKPMYLSDAIKAGKFDAYRDIIKHEVVNFNLSYPHPYGFGMGREVRIREHIRHAWLRDGIGKDDIGFIGDCDEVPRRDFIAALKWCLPFDGMPCNNGKLIGRSLQHNHYFQCIDPKREYYWHPDAVRGECLGVIPKDSTDGVPLMPSDQSVPWSGEDVRTRAGGVQVSAPTGWHFSSFLPKKDIVEKYRSYAHAIMTPDFKTLATTPHNNNLLFVKDNCIAKKPPGAYVPFQELDLPELMKIKWEFWSQFMLPEDTEAEWLVNPEHHQPDWTIATFADKWPPLPPPPAAQMISPDIERERMRVRRREGLIETDGDIGPGAGNGPSRRKSRRSGEGGDFRNKQFRMGLRKRKGGRNSPREKKRHMKGLFLGREPPEFTHVASPSGSDAVMGLMVSRKEEMNSWVNFAGSLRSTGYDGHIILGTRRDLSPREIKFFAAHHVTTVAVDLAECEGSAAPPNVAQSGLLSCAKNYADLKIEWARHSMVLDWLVAMRPLAGQSVNGWVLVCDVRDVFFQRPPFYNMPSSGPNLYLVEEFRITTSHWFVKMCYDRCPLMQNSAGGYDHSNKTMLCSGTTVGKWPGTHGIKK